MKQLLNGKKTFLGIVALVVVGVLQAVGVLTPEVGSVAMLLAQGLLGVGVAHKAEKVIGILGEVVRVGRYVAEHWAELVALGKAMTGETQEQPPEELPASVAH